MRKQGHTAGMAWRGVAVRVSITIPILLPYEYLKNGGGYDIDQPVTFASTPNIQIVFSFGILTSTTSKQPIICAFRFLDKSEQLVSSDPHFR
jgi:hypothetical protein